MKLSDCPVCNPEHYCPDPAPKAVSGVRWGFAEWMQLGHYWNHVTSRGTPAMASHGSAIHAFTNAIKHASTDAERADAQEWLDIGMRRAQKAQTPDTWKASMFPPIGAAYSR